MRHVIPVKIANPTTHKVIIMLTYANVKSNYGNAYSYIKRENVHFQHCDNHYKQKQ